MLYTPHFLTGVALAHNLSNPWLGLPLALLSHVVLDLIPHSDLDLHPGITIQTIFNYPQRRRLFIFGVLTADALLLIASFFWLLFTHTNPIYPLAGGMVAILPDLIEQGMMILGVPLIGFQERFQNRVSLHLGFISYPIVCLVALYFLQS